MLYHLLPRFADVHIVFNVFTYITFRAAGAVVTSLLIAFVLLEPRGLMGLWLRVRNYWKAFPFSY